MRVPGERAQKNIEAVVGELLSNAFGGDLLQYCHVEKEPSIYTLLLKNLCTMEVDLRPLLGGAPVYDTKKHIAKLRLQRTLPGLYNSETSSPDKFLRCFSWKAETGQVMSEGMGVNMWALLLMGSLMGSDEIHTKQSNRVANALLSLILRLAPPGATPGNMIPVRGINEHSHHPESIIVPGKNRCEHFIRPVNDDNMAINGRFTYCQVMKGGLLPEDYLGLAPILGMSDYLACKYWEVPPQYLEGHIQIMQGRWYCIRKHSEVPSEVVEGTLIIDKGGAHVSYEDRVAIWSYEEWQKELKAAGFLVMPTVTRCGAVVTYDDGTKVGCLVPNGTRAAMVLDGFNIAEGSFVSNFDHINVRYSALVEEGTLLHMPVIDTIESLVPPGTVLWIKPDSQTWADLSEFFPPMSTHEDEEDKRMVQARLNIPTNTVRLVLFIEQRGVTDTARAESNAGEGARDGSAAPGHGLAHHQLSPLGGGPLGAQPSCTSGGVFEDPRASDLKEDGRGGAYLWRSSSAMPLANGVIPRCG